jgi:multidrug efflux pump subunit AcrA (membrane-fusion protein)
LTEALTLEELVCQTDRSYRVTVGHYRSGRRLVADALFGTGSTPDQAQAGGRKVLYYKSTMMLGEISQTSRKDSMGMDMVPVYEGEEDSTAITIDPVTMQNMGVRTAPVTQGPVHRTIRTVGRIEFDETAVSEVTTRVPGWIETLYVDSTGKLVHKGEPLFEFYSPDLYLTQREYLLALVQGDEAAAPVLNKLYHLGLSVGQIENLRKTHQVPHTLQIVSPRDGVVVEKNALQGTMTEPGKTLYRIGDIGKVWVLAEIYEQDLPFLQVGQQALVKLSYMADRSFRGKVTYIYPTVEEKTRTARARMEFPNPGFFLKPGMFVTVEIHALLVSEAVLVPDMLTRSGRTRLLDPRCDLRNNAASLNCFGLRIARTFFIRERSATLISNGSAVAVIPAFITVLLIVFGIRETEGMSARHRFRSPRILSDCWAPQILSIVLVGRYAKCQRAVRDFIGRLSSSRSAPSNAFSRDSGLA